MCAFAARNSSFPIREPLKGRGIQGGDIGGEGVGHDGEQGRAVTQLGEDLPLPLPVDRVADDAEHLLDILPLLLQVGRLALLQGPCSGRRPPSTSPTPNRCRLPPLPPGTRLPVTLLPLGDLLAGQPAPRPPC